MFGEGIRIGLLHFVRMDAHKFIGCAHSHFKNKSFGAV